MATSTAPAAPPVAEAARNRTLLVGTAFGAMGSIMVLSLIHI